MPININPQVAPQVASKVLALSGKSEDDFYVRAIEIDSVLKRCAIKVFGSMAQIASYACRKHVPNSIRLLALQSANGVSFELVKRDKVKEGLVGACRYLPYVGVGVGLVAGLIHRAVASSGSPGRLSQVLEVVNSLKQWEVKKIAYLTPFIIPVAIHMASNLSSGAENKLMQRAIGLMKFGLRRKLKQDPGEHQMAVIGLEINRWVLSFLKVVNATFKTRVPYLMSVGALGLSNNLWAQAANYLVPGFDLSGHCFLKTASAALLSSELRAVNKKVSTSASWALFGYAALYAVSDAVLMFNTVAYHHTVVESVTGVACAALGIWQLDKLTRHVRKQVEKE